jgi:Flp pilus assembly protein CpaB
VAVVLFVVAALLGTAIVGVILLTGGQTYEAPVASRNLEPNTRIQSDHLQTKTFDEAPGESVITDREQLIGRVTTREVSGESTFTASDVRDQFETVYTTQSIPAGTRIQRGMVQVQSAEEKPSDAVADPEIIVGKMVRESLPADHVVQRSDVYIEEQEYVVAQEPIEANSIVRQEQVRVVNRPTGPADGLSDPSRVTGKPIKRSLSPGDVVRESDVYSGDPQLSYFIPMYKRAVSIPVANQNQYSYMMKPGDLVDLYAYSPRSQEIPMGGEEVEEETVHTLQKIADGATVLSLNDRFTTEQIRSFETGGGTGTQNQKNFEYQSMTLGVSLKEAERVSLVRGMSSSGVNIDFYAVLRPRILESDYGISRDITDFELFNPSAESRNNRLNGEKTVEVIHGGSKEVYRVPSR